jgi:hypothetical protein
MVKDWLSFRSWPSNPQASLIPSAAMELSLFKVSSMANVRRSSAAILFYFFGGIKEDILSTKEREVWCEIIKDETKSVLK